MLDWNAPPLAGGTRALVVEHSTLFCLRNVNAKTTQKHSSFTLAGALLQRLGGVASVLSPLPLCATSPPRLYTKTAQ